MQGHRGADGAEDRGAGERRVFRDSDDGERDRHAETGDREIELDLFVAMGRGALPLAYTGRLPRGTEKITA